MDTKITKTSQILINGKEPEVLAKKVKLWEIEKKSINQIISDILKQKNKK